MGAVRHGGRRANADEGEAARTTARHVAIQRVAAGPVRDRPGVAGRGTDAAVALLVPSRAVWSRSTVDQGRIAFADRELQESRAGDGDHDGQALGSPSSRFALRRKCGGCRSGLCGASGSRSLRLHAARHPHRERLRMPTRRCEDISRQRTHYRLRSHRARREAADELVRSLDAQGAVSHRR